MTKNSRSALANGPDRQRTPMEGEIDPRNTLFKISSAIAKAAQRSRVFNQKSVIDPDKK